MQAVKTTTLREGTTDLIVPDLKEPKMIPGFFNPQGKYVRDVSVVCYDSYGIARGKSDLSFADSMAGVGARGVRVAHELLHYSQVYLNDVNSFSLDLGRLSAKLNSVESKCHFSKSETCSFLTSREVTDGERFDVVDLDPFGTPSPFVDCLIRSVKEDGLLSVSATDSAVLCGIYPRVTLRKYQGLPLRTEYCHEIGMRLMFGLLATTAMRFEAGIEPKFCHHDKHYFRIYCAVKIGNRWSIENEKKIGFVIHCFSCGYRKTIAHSEFMHSKEGEFGAGNLICPECKSSRMRLGGPLWIGNIQSQEFVKKCAEISGLAVFEPELDLPLYYDVSVLSDEWGVRTPRINDVVNSLRSSGRSASRTRLNPNAVRTDAPLDEIQSLLVRLSR
ncbi:MAG: hypothetical protein JRN52_13525 [Nitrososphaerota archaeon]|nr:hypothetical protein [Nitrososphaerota archaeon]